MRWDCGNNFGISNWIELGWNLATIYLRRSKKFTETITNWAHDGCSDTMMSMILLLLQMRVVSKRMQSLSSKWISTLTHKPILPLLVLPRRRFRTYATFLICYIKMAMKWHTRLSTHTHTVTQTNATAHNHLKTRGHFCHPLLICQMLNIPKNKIKFLFEFQFQKK